MVTIFRPCRAAKPCEVGQARHRAVVVHDLADDAGRVEAGEAREVDRRLGLTGAHEHAALAARAAGRCGPGVTRSSGRRRRVDGDADGVRAVGGADAGGDAVRAPRCRR